MFDMRNRFDLTTPPDMVNRRLAMIQMKLQQNKPVEKILEHYDISRPVFYKHFNRYKEYGKLGLYNLSKAPLHHGRETSSEKQEELLQLYHKHPYFSSYEFQELVSIPAKTIQKILKRKKIIKSYLPKSKKKTILEKLKKELRQKGIQKK